ncbi:HAD family hydrolase [bacterium]|nr:HAD family hydrolase [candidate division CSSED10-310 bacterium]
MLLSYWKNTGDATRVLTAAAVTAVVLTLAPDSEHDTEEGRGADMSSYSVVCFDLFDTIVTFDTDRYNEFRRQRLNSLAIDSNAFIAAWTATQADAMNGLYARMDERCETVLQAIVPDGDFQELLTHVVSAERAALRHAARPVEGMKGLLIELLTRKKRLGLISNCSCSGPVLLETLGWQHYFDEQVYSYIEKIHKPNPDIYLLACDRLHVSPDMAAFVSDGDRYELTGASDAGLDPVRFDPSSAYFGHPLPPGCYDCGKDISKLRRVLLT